MWPSPDALRCGRNALVPYTTPQKLMPINHSKSSYDIDSMVAPSATPALLTTRLTAPWSSTTWSAQRYTASRSETSTRCEVTLTPAPSHKPTVSARPTSSMSESASWARRPASSRASARPIPDPAPVMAATRPLNSFTILPLTLLSARCCPHVCPHPHPAPPHPFASQPPAATPAWTTGSRTSSPGPRCRCASTPCSRAGSSGAPATGTAIPAWGGDRSPASRTRR